jgi:hypothetical protein
LFEAYPPVVFLLSVRTRCRHRGLVRVRNRLVAQARTPWTSAAGLDVASELVDALPGES